MKWSEFASSIHSSMVLTSKANQMKCKHQEQVRNCGWILRNYELEGGQLNIVSCSPYQLLIPKIRILIIFQQFLNQSDCFDKNTTTNYQKKKLKTIIDGQGTRI